MSRPRKQPLPTGIYVRKLARGRESYWIDFALPSGKRQRERAGTTIDEAKRRRALRLAQVREGTFCAGSGTGAQTLDTYAARWIDSRRAGKHVRDVEHEAQMLRDHVSPHLGRKRLDEIRPRDVVAWIRTLSTAGALARKSISNVHGVLNSLLQDACRDDLIVGNPARGLSRSDLPGVRPTREVAAWTRAEVEALIADDRIPEDRRVAYAIAAFTGARLGEVAGLRWSDLDTAGLPLWCWDLRTQWDREPLKTDRRRRVPIHPELRRVLEDWKREGWARFVCRRPTADDLVVPRANGTIHADNSLGAKSIQRHARRVGIDPTHRNFHSLRRAFITLARTDGAPADVVERITHNKRGEMIDRYTFFGWQPLCDAVAAVRVVVRSGALSVAANTAAANEPGLPADVSRHASRHAAGGTVALVSVFDELGLEVAGVEPHADRGTPPDSAALGAPRRATGLGDLRVEPRGTAEVPPPVTSVSCARRDAAAAVLAGAAAGQMPVAALDALVRSVLDEESVRLALQVTEGGPFAARRAIELAALVLGRGAGTDARDANRRAG